MKEKKTSLICLVLFILVVLVDQLVKYYVKTHFMPGEDISVTSWFHLYFVENEGMAFGMDFIATRILALFRIVAIPLFIYFVWLSIKRHKKRGFSICLTLIAAGAFGNIIDNLFYGLGFSAPDYLYQLPSKWVGLGNGVGGWLEGHVVDMFYFPLFTWPDAMPLLGGKVFFNAIFNVADAAISCGAIVLLIAYSSQISSKNED